MNKKEKHSWIELKGKFYLCVICGRMCWYNEQDKNVAVYAGGFEDREIVGVIDEN